MANYKDIKYDQAISDYDKTLMTNVAMLGFYRASDNAEAKYNLVDQIVDEYQDNSGVDTGASSGLVLGGSGDAKYYGGAASSTADTVTTTYTYDGSDDSIALNNLQSIAGTIRAWGGGGGADSSGSGKHGGGGGYITGTLAYTSDGTDLLVSVGQGGPIGTKAGSGGSGGGYSGVFLGSKTFANTIIIAAGAGGAGDGQDGPGGGGTTGGRTSSTGGYGGTPSAGGALGSGSSTHTQPTTGSALQGGIGGAEETSTGSTAYNGGGKGGSEPGGYMAGGGGGGGYYGGAGGHAGNAGYAGGGGSSYHSTTYISSATNTAGGANAPGYTSTNYPAGVGTSALSSNGGPGAVYITYAITTPQSANITLQSLDTTASAVPSSGDMVLMIENATGTATINTDIKGYISRDSGANWTQGTLVEEGTWGTDKKVIAFHQLDISGQPSGTSMCYKITTHNQSGSKLTRVHATSIAWS